MLWFCFFFLSLLLVVVCLQQIESSGISYNLLDLFFFFFFLTLKRSFYDPCARAQLEPTRISARLELLLVS